MSEKRTSHFQRNLALEILLSQLGEDLEPATDRLISKYQHQSIPHPLILILGPLRSGTTLFMQWLAHLGIIAYPTNLLSRFYHSPILGAKIQLLLTDPRFSFRDELEEFSKQLDFVSENGKTRGVLSPNEFWYFWRRFLPEATLDIWTDDQLRREMDINKLRAEIAGITDVFDKPFAAKAMLFNYNIPFLDSIFDKVLFIQMKRNLTDNISSVLEARKRQLGSEHAWYSFKIPEYNELEKLDPIRQATGQVCAINRAVNIGMSQVSESRKLLVDYETFCTNPEIFFHEIVDRIGFSNIDQKYFGPEKFLISRLASGQRKHVIRRAISEIHPWYKCQ